MCLSGCVIPRGPPCCSMRGAAAGVGYKKMCVGTEGRGAGCGAAEIQSGREGTCALCCTVLPAIARRASPRRRMVQAAQRVREGTPGVSRTLASLLGTGKRKREEGKDVSEPRQTLAGLARGGENTHTHTTACSATPPQVVRCATLLSAVLAGKYRTDPHRTPRARAVPGRNHREPFESPSLPSSHPFPRGTSLILIVLRRPSRVRTYSPRGGAGPVRGKL